MLFIKLFKEMRKPALRVIRAKSFNFINTNFIYIISNLIIPIICIFIMLYTCCLSFFTKIKPLSYLSINILVILIPILLVLRHYTTNNILSYLAILIFIIIFIALYFFRHDELREELIKIFRI